MVKTRMAWWLKVTVVFVIGRAISTVMLLILASQQEENPWTGSQPSLWDFSSLWDGRWYNIIAESGYPTELPVTAEGKIAENAWAFMPVYPSLVRGLMAVTGMPWNVSAIIVSVGFAWAATMVLYRILVKYVPAQQALFAVVLFSVAPVSPLFQLAYAESMQLFLIGLSIYLLQRRRYIWMIPVILALSFTRPGALAVSAMLGMHLIYRFATRKRSHFTIKDRITVSVVFLISVIAGFAWLAIAGVVTGNPTAYIDTELAWRSAYVGYQELIPFTPWIIASQWWMSFFNFPVWAGYGLLAILVVGFVIFLFLPATKKLGLDIRFWLASYGLYVLAVFFPQSSTFRILAPLFPALGVLAAPRSKIYRVVMVVIFIGLQWGWLLIGWRVDGYDWTPP